MAKKTKLSDAPESTISDQSIPNHTRIIDGVEHNDPVPLVIDLTPPGGSLEDQIKRMIRQAQADGLEYDTFDEDQDYEVDDEAMDGPVESIFQEVDSLITNQNLDRSAERSEVSEGQNSEQTGEAGSNDLAEGLKASESDADTKTEQKTDAG